jgi:hypothetical protein
MQTPGALGAARERLSRQHCRGVELLEVVSTGNPADHDSTAAGVCLTGVTLRQGDCRGGAIHSIISRHTDRLADGWQRQVQHGRR